VAFRLKPFGPTAGAFALDNSEIATILGPVGCLAGETEYLSPVGWRRIDAYDGGLVGMWENGQLSFVQPIEYIDEPCGAPMLEFKNKYSLHMILTPNHSVPLYDWKGSFCVRTAQRIFDKPSTYKIPTTFTAAGGLGLTESEIRLRVMIAADGHYPKKGQQCVVSVRKNRKKERLRWLLETAGIQYTETVYSQRPTEARFAFARPDHPKELEPSWFRASSEELAILLDEMPHWDGLFEGLDMRFNTTKKFEADIVQFAAHANEKRGSICVSEYERESWSDVYVTHICRGLKANVRLRGGGYVSRRRVRRDRQYCFTLSSGFFLARCSDRIFITGNSAKTTAACARLGRHAYEQKADEDDGVARTRWAIVRNTKRQLQDTTLKTWLQVFPENIYGEYHKTSATHHWRFKPRGANHVIDAEFVFRALDDEKDIANLLSAEYTGAWFNEIREINEEILTTMGRRVGRYPGVGRNTWYGWIGDTNAWHQEHHLHDWFVINPREGYRFFRQPGGMDSGAENLENLEGGRDYYVRALRDYNPYDADIYVHAKIGVSRSGKPCYVSYADSVHCAEFEFDKEAPILIGYDFGRTPAAVIAQRTTVGQWRIGYEFCGFDLGVAPHAERLKGFLSNELPGVRLQKITGDPAGIAKNSFDMDDFRILRNIFRVPALPANTNDFDMRIEAVDGSFRRLVNGGPAILIHPRCRMLRQACISRYRYRKLKLTGQRYSDEPDKNEHSHVAEALQYLLLGGGEGRAAMGATVSPNQSPPPEFPTDGSAIRVGKAVQRGRAGWNPFQC